MPYIFTPVELKALSASPFEAIYQPQEKIPAIVVDNFPALGRLAAMRFLEWVQHNPGGVISLPTGKTPEHFISWVCHLLRTWNTPETGKLLEASGLDPAHKPDMKGLSFVQIDEFYPLPSTQHNSFHHYVNKFYLEGFGLDPARALLIDGGLVGLKAGQRWHDTWPEGTCDLSLRVRSARTALERMQKDAIERIDQWCQEYEDRVRVLGGIGFFMGGIGPDGHIGFNVSGSDHHSTTRLTPTNYPTQAASASDLGGIEVSRQRLVITIGLETITYNKNVAAIIIAAGEAKAKIVADAIQHEKSVLHPATCLHGLPNTRFYLTVGAAKLLSERCYAALTAAKSSNEEDLDRALVDLCVAKHKRLLDLATSDVMEDRFAAYVLKSIGLPLVTAVKGVYDRLVNKLERGAKAKEGARFLHTEPHHDDIMLGYLPAVVRNIRSAANEHFFATLTSGFTAVTNAFMKKRLANLAIFLNSPTCLRLHKEGYFSPTNMQARNRDVWQYLDGVASSDAAMQQEGQSRRDLRNLVAVFGDEELHKIKEHLAELERYLHLAYPGQKDPEYVQQLKGMYREWEAETLWGYFGWRCENVSHLRLAFYTGDIFTPEPTIEHDVPPVVDLLRRTRPDVVSVALDPEASGPDTHYKVMQATSAALHAYAEETGQSGLTVWGYRNVWFRFHPAEANLFVPVSLNMFSVMESSFLHTFISQKEASFPSYEHDGPFCQLAQKIQVEQYEKIKTCLGREWFQEHKSALIRATRGLVFMQEMKLADFHQFCRQLRKAAENR